MNGDGIDTTTVLKVLLAVAAFVIGFILFGSLIRFLGQLIWLFVGVLVFLVLALLALRLLKDIL